MSVVGGLLGGAAGAIGNIFGGISKNKMIKEQMRLVNEQKKQNQNWYDRRYNEDSTQRADAQRLLAITEENIKRRNRAAAGTAAVMGDGAERVAATQEANSKALADVTSQIAANGERRKDAIEQQYRQNDAAYNAQLRQLKGQKQSALDIAAGALGGAAGGIVPGSDIEDTLNGKLDEYGNRYGY